MKSDDLVAIVDFLYRGEANVYQENLESFLAIAEELQLKGLMGKTDKKVKDFEDNEKYLPPTLSPDNAKIPKASFKRQPPNSEIHHSGQNGTLAIPGNFSGDLVQLEERVKSMMEKSQNRVANGSKFTDRCKVCGKEGQQPHIKDHIEANHLEGIVIPCNLCDKTFSTRPAVRKHKAKAHPGQIQ